MPPLGLVPPIVEAFYKLAVARKVSMADNLRKRGMMSKISQMCASCVGKIKSPLTIFSSIARLLLKFGITFLIDSDCFGVFRGLFQSLFSTEGGGLFLDVGLYCGGSFHLLSFGPFGRRGIGGSLHVLHLHLQGLLWRSALGLQSGLWLGRSLKTSI